MHVDIILYFLCCVVEGKMHFDDLNLKENYHPWRAYSQSKLANVLFTRELHNKLQGGLSVLYDLDISLLNE